jgi:hypothetical protein
MRSTDKEFPAALIATTKTHPLATLFEAEPMIHPHVLEAYEQAVKVLNEQGISFRATGGIALNLFQAGRPTQDVDLIVSRVQWHQARQALQSIATDVQGIIFGLPDEPENGLALVGPHGVSIELWPEGTTHKQIALIRGKHREHPAGDIPLRLGGDDLVELINSKLASYLSATDRLRDAADVQSLVSRRALLLEFEAQLAPAVRSTYRRIWRGEM